MGLQVLIYPWVYQRAANGGETAVPPTLWFAIDILFPVWLLAPYVTCIVVAVAALATWRVVLLRNKLLKSKSAIRLVITGAALSSVGAVALAVLSSPPVLGHLARPLLCQTTTFESAISPSGRYVADVVEVDCGAMSRFNRQVLLTRRPFGWAQT